MLTKKDLQLITQALEPRFKALEDTLENKIIEFKVDILKQIQDLRDDVAIVIGYKDDIENHEVRIAKVEKQTGITP